MNPFAPLSTAPESTWSADDHQRAANFHWYEMQGFNERAYQAGECGPNYKPMQTLHRSAYETHTRKARALRESAE